jgi:hypothetical protein
MTRKIIERSLSYIGRTTRLLTTAQSSNIPSTVYKVQFIRHITSNHIKHLETIIEVAESLNILPQRGPRPR